MATAGIYRIALTDGRCYIGQSVNIESRFRGHRLELRKGTHHSRYLQNAWNRYGEGAFTFEVVETISLDALTRAEAATALAWREQHWIDVSASVFNTCPAAATVAGIERSAEYRAKISALHKGRKHTDEARRNMSRGQRNRPPVGDATRAKLSAAGRGRPQSEEHKAKRAAAQRGKPSPLRGVPKAPEHVAKVSAALKGHAVPEKTRQAVAEANRRRVLSEKTRAKMSAAQKARRARERSNADSERGSAGELPAQRGSF